jgi:Sugar (and other) transporter
MLAYLAAFSPGMGPVPWAVNAEIYPLQLRGLANGAATASNWLANAAVRTHIGRFICCSLKRSTAVPGGLCDTKLSKLHGLAAGQPDLPCGNSSTWRVWHVPCVCLHRRRRCSVGVLRAARDNRCVPAAPCGISRYVNWYDWGRAPTNIVHYCMLLSVTTAPALLAVKCNNIQSCCCRSNA